jgi:hypothetical protein
LPNSCPNSLPNSCPKALPNSSPTYIVAGLWNSPLTAFTSYNSSSQTNKSQLSKLYKNKLSIRLFSRFINKTKFKFV